MPHADPLRTPDDATPGVPFFGRNEELAALDSCLRAAADGTGRLVLIEGRTGIGKTALVRRFLRVAGQVTTLAAGGVEDESALAYGVLGRLLSPAPASASVATAEALRERADVFAAGSLLLDRISCLEDGRTAVLVLDDAHWADTPSLRALAFALRRLDTGRVMAVLTVPDLGDARLPEGLHRLLDDDSTLRLLLGGLPAAQLAALSTELLNDPLPLSAVKRLHEHTHGNPLHACALLRQVPPAQLASPDADLPAPRSFGLLVVARLARCAYPTQQLVAAASVLGMTSPLALAARLASTEDPLPAVEEAATQDLLHLPLAVGPPSLAFSHPLIRAAVYHHIGPARRAVLHTQAALLAEDDFSALQHRLLGAAFPDPPLAADLAAGARRAMHAGSGATAAMLAGHASRLAATDTARAQFAVEATDALLHDGRVAEAAEALGTLPGDAASASHRYVQGRLALVRGETRDALALLEDAWTRCPEPALARRIAEQLTCACLIRCNTASVSHWADLAQALPRTAFGSGMLRFAQVAALGIAGATSEGLACVRELPARVLVQEDDADLLLGRGALRLWSDDLKEGHADLRAALPLCRRGPAALQVLARVLLGEAEFRLGRWDDAALHLESASSTCTDTGQLWLAPMAYGQAAIVLAARGAQERAARYLQTLRADNVQCDEELAGCYGARAHAQLAVLCGAPEQAVSALRPVLDGAVRVDPGVVTWADLLAESLVELGEYDEAEIVLGRLEETAAARRRHSALASVGRIKGGLLSARHDKEAAERAYLDGLGHADQVGNPFERARLTLDFGAFLRRTGRRSEAAAHLRRSMAAFTELGAAPYLARCEREFQACGYRAAPVSPQMPSLTPQELAIARLVTTGRTNRQIARELMLSIKTVEYHLSHIYAKLDNGSRVALINLLTAGR
ncbi:helix-turn-helix transcriptional regulator [Streptomyces sclerotialus]|uniref:helix-turn-helix transcriptional regulator n=1 Tax=Streptomyces sclerotialus TaxID=1957 RepID=UPI0007C5BF2C